jgi:23S rRNA (uridine2552-2'-O)-methyltransferase
MMENLYQKFLWVPEAKLIFKDVKVFKPKSSRKDSKESFIICKFLR